MFRIEAAVARALFLGALGSLANASVAAQDGPPDAERDGPAPVDSTQSISAGADSDIVERSRDARGAGAGHVVGTAGAAGALGRAPGTYAGVVPGTAHVAPAAARAEHIAKGAPSITWPGFQMRPDGSSRVFIQSTTALEPKVLTADNGKFELQLPRARVAEKTNRLPLDTRFFNTPVTKVSVNVARSGAVVQLEMRAPVTPHVSSEAGAAGYFFTYIELPKGEYLKPATSASSGTGTVQTLPTLQAAKPSSKVIGKAATSVTTSQSQPSAQGEASLRGGMKLGH